MTPEHEQAANLLGIIWKGIPADYKSRYRRSIWQQFEDNIRSAACSTSRMGEFISKLCFKFSASIGRNDEDRMIAKIILQETDAWALLKLLREETTLLVLMVRVANQERREAWEAEHPELEEESRKMEGIKIVDGIAQFDYDERGMLPANLVADIEDFIRVTRGTKEDFLSSLTEERENENALF